MLNNRQTQFVAYYGFGMSGAEAARKVGYSKQRARQTAHDLLQIPEIQDEVSLLRRHCQLKAFSDAEKRIKELNDTLTLSGNVRAVLRAATGITRALKVYEAVCNEDEGNRDESLPVASEAGGTENMPGSEPGSFFARVTSFGEKNEPNNPLHESTTEL